VGRSGRMLRSWTPSCRLSDRRHRAVDCGLSTVDSPRDSRYRP
jgi:hypothetical protein